MSKICLPKTIKMVITDFDGVMTDGCVYISDSGEFTRKVNFQDVMGMSLLKKAGFKLGIISGEGNKAIEMLAKKFQIEEVHQSIRVKIDVLKGIIERHNLTQEEYVYIGDDVNDLACLEYAKYKITIPHAPARVKAVEGIQVTEKTCGNGAFREVADCLTT
ncbi:MAG: HAD hydrolase-like protein [Fusobacterium sp.]|nr:HAD hydrolase-like protein [Fusobacterium sp.]